MNRKAIITIQIIIAAIALTYFIMPDLLVGPFDDGVLAVLAICAEVALFIVQAVRKPSNSRPNYNNTSYQQNYQNNAYSNNTNYQHYDQANGANHYSNDQDDEFQFFAGCTYWEQVKSRYRDLMKIYHPDAGGHEEASKKINAEYNELKKRFGH